MFDNDWFKKRGKHLPHDNLFNEVDKMEKLMWKILENFLPQSNLEFKDMNKSFIYCFSIFIGPDGHPIIREIGNVKANLNQMLIREENEPLTDIMKSNESIKIYIELPGVKKEDIKLKTKSNKLIISALNEDRRYHREIDLPLRIEPKDINATYRNGVLEIIIKKKSAKKTLR